MEVGDASVGQEAFDYSVALGVCRMVGSKGCERRVLESQSSDRSVDLRDYEADRSSVVDGGF